MSGNMFEQHSEGIARIMQNPDLGLIAWEATRNCNLKCIHCCLPKSEWKMEKELTTSEVKRIFSEIAQDFDVSKISVGITGGEPTIREDLVEIVKFLVSLNFRSVSVDSNGYCYGKDLSLIDHLVEAGMTSPTLSIDGLREGYCKMRGGDYFDNVMRALIYIISKYPDTNPTVISVVSKYNKHEIPKLFDTFESIGVRYARISPVMPLGRADNGNDYQLSDEEVKDLLLWVAQKRCEWNSGEFKMEIEFVDDGWCGRCLEGAVRSWYYWCQTGLSMAFIRYDGKISACSNIPDDLAIQGDARCQRFKDVWVNEFKMFRNKDWLKQGSCASCGEWKYCYGGPMHYRDSKGNMKKCLFLTINNFDKLCEINK